MSWYVHKQTAIIFNLMITGLSTYWMKEGWFFRFYQKWLHSTSELSSKEATVGAKNSVSAEHRALLSRKSTNTRRSTFPAAYSCLDAYWVYNALMSCNVPTHCLLSWIKLLILWNHCPLRDSFRQFQRNQTWYEVDDLAELMI